MSRRLLGSVVAVAAIVGAVTVGLNAYTTYTSARWPNASATFYVNTGSVTDVSPNSAVAAIQTAMDVWNTQSGSTFRFVYGGTTSANQLANDGVNAVFFRQATNGGAIASNYTWWDGSNRIVDSDVVFWDAERTFFTGTSGCTSGAYIEDVAAHEFGHAMALGHSSYAEATMYSSYGSCNQGLRTLAADDIEGARALYPSSSQTINTAPSVSISSPANGASFAEGVSVSFVGSASDGQDGSLTAALQWTDNGNAIGSGGSFSRVLTAGTHTITAYAIDSGSLQGTRTVSVTVTTSASSSPGGTNGTLTVRGRKVKGLQKADLSWSGLSATTIDVYRNGLRVMGTSNDGFETDAINRKGSGSYAYQVCAAGTSACSNTAVVVF